MFNIFVTSEMMIEHEIDYIDLFVFNPCILELLLFRESFSFHKGLNLLT